MTETGYRGLLLGAVGVLLVGQVLGLWLGRDTQAAEPESPPAQAIYATGTIFREEVVIQAPETGAWWPLLESGEKVAQGQALFSTEPATTATAALGAYYQSLPLPQRRTALHAAIAAGDDITPILLGESQDTLALEVPTQGETITAPVSGIFSPQVDGLEEAQVPIWRISLPRKPVSSLALGRIVTGDGWYLALTLDAPPEVGAQLQLELLSGVFLPCTMEVVAAEGNQILLAADTNLAAIVDLREITVKILSES